MPLKILSIQASKYVLIIAMLGLGWIIDIMATKQIGIAFSSSGEHSGMLLILFACVIIFSLGFLVYQLAKPTVIPSFVLAVLFGIVTRDILSIVVNNKTSLVTLITIGAVLILFDGGLDTPFKKFKKLFFPILSLAIIGTFINSFLLSLTAVTFARITNTSIGLPMLLLLGAAIASTDPAAIIPCFKRLYFKKSRVKHIAISESAINDVVGAVLVSLFLALFLDKSQVPMSIWNGYQLLFTPNNLLMLLSIILIGTLAGVAGFAILSLWGRWKQKLQAEEGTDAALFIAVPLFAFTTAELLGGSGFLAVFISGLLFHMRAHYVHVEHYFNHTIEGFMKPMIFMLLGAIVPPEALLAHAPFGILLGVFTIVILRPLIVLITLTPFCFTKLKLTWRELAFLSFVRETGVIPAALLIAISATGISGYETATAVGLWVIIITLVVQPPLTPLLAKFLNIASSNSFALERKHMGPVAILCSRGNSYVERIATVTKWADEHAVDNIILLHCPEERYCTEFVSKVEENAQVVFKTINDARLDEGKRLFNFEILCGPGLLQENIEKLIAAGDVSIIFVGNKMLDYRLEDVKKLSVPMFFMN